MARVVVITGAASGIGRATALAFADEGARLHLVDISRDGLQSLCREVKAKGCEATDHIVDCRDAAALMALAERVYAAEGRVDVLFNNAGVGFGGPTATMTEEDWRFVLDLNVYGVVWGVRAFLPRMEAQGGTSVIVNTASVAGLVPFPMMAAYCASKFAVVGLSEAMDLELRPKGIRVVAICPGIIDTPILKHGRINLPTAKKAEKTWAQGAPPAVVADAVVKATRAYKSPVVVPRATAALITLTQLSRGLTKAAIRRVADWQGING